MMRLRTMMTASMEPILTTTLSPDSVYHEMRRLMLLVTERRHDAIHYRVSHRALFEIQCHEAFSTPYGLKPDDMVKGYLFGAAVIALPDDEMQGDHVQIVNGNYDENTA